MHQNRVDQRVVERDPDVTGKELVALAVGEDDHEPPRCGMVEVRIRERADRGEIGRPLIRREDIGRRRRADANCISDDGVEDRRITGREEMRQNEDRKRRDAERNVRELGAYAVGDFLRALKPRRTAEPAGFHRP